MFSPLHSEKVPLNLSLSCSPKSMYSLAKLMAVEELVNLAYEHIERSISASNVVTELFSSITASDDRILEMESDLLFGEFENDRTSQEVHDRIRDMSRGKAIFQAKTLGFAYHRLLVKKRHAVQEPPRCEPQESREPLSGPLDELEVMLHCARYRTHAYALSDLLQGLYCPECHEFGKNGRREYGRPFTRCGHCNALRDTASHRCGSCRSLFKPHVNGFWWS